MKQERAIRNNLSPSKVAVVKCSEYEEGQVVEAVGRGLSLIGGIEQFVKKDERILLKPNMLVGTVPEKAVTTHPAVFKAVARHLLGQGAQLTYGDSPGFGRPDSVARKAGLSAAADELGIPLADFSTGSTVSFPEGHLIKQFTLAKGVLDCDGIVSLPKMKTHALTRLTGAVKIHFGCIPGLLKGEFHARMSDMERFSKMLVDLTRYLRPRLYVMDAVVAMEGNGPRSGTPRPMHAILVSTDPVAMDAVACRMMALDPTLVPTNVWGEELGLGSYTNIETVGDSVASFVVKDFKVNRTTGSTTGSMNSRLARILRNRVVPRPAINAARCTRCGTCVKVCPVTPKAVDFQNREAGGPPVHTYSRCIRCYCCQEMCPENAITVITPPIGRLLHR
ncbi:MAG TPA: DUF362 domain-containing protein [Candidatus Hydrogenedentes bacterium]|nr:DUF362 domain-containing protein [Candidatus Hydrogenedentota bacterium]